MTKEVKRYTFFAYLDDEVAELDCREEEVGDYVLASDYAALEQECDAALLQVEALREALEEAQEAIRRADFDTGVCCCGSPTATHGFGDGHSPIDEGGYYALGLLQRIDAALQAKP